MILSYLESHDCIEDTWEFASSIGLDHQIIVGVVKSLLPDEYLQETPLTKSFWVATEEGEVIASEGSPEFRVFILQSLGEIFLMHPMYVCVCVCTHRCSRSSQKQE